MGETPIRLPDTRTHQERSFTFSRLPGADRWMAAVLRQRKARKARSGELVLGPVRSEFLAAREIGPTADGDRGFEVRRLSNKPVETRWVHLPANPERTYCSCPGHSFEATARADRADGGRYSDSLGCVHADLTLAMVRAGAFGAGGKVRASGDAVKTTGPTVPAQTPDRSGR